MNFAFGGVVHDADDDDNLCCERCYTTLILTYVLTKDKYF